MKAAIRHKTSGLEPHLAVLHDLTCPAFSLSSVAKCLPGASFAGIDTAYWESACLKATENSDLSKAVSAWNEAQVLSRAAVTLKTADPHALDRIRLANHEAFLAANAEKTFRDATPGPGSRADPGRLRRAGLVPPAVHHRRPRRRVAAARGRRARSR